jgi:hypothetical protein
MPMQGIKPPAHVRMRSNLHLVRTAANKAEAEMGLDGTHLVLSSGIPFPNADV